VHHKLVPIGGKVLKIYLKILIMRTFAPSVNLKQFFATCPIPIYVVSNIDRNDVLQAIDYHGLKPTGVFTSEDAKSYKPKR